jgi:hypothetical protein
MAKPRSFKPSPAALIPILMGPICAGVMAKDAAGNLPKRVRLAKWGTNKARGLGPNGTDAEFVVNETTLAVLPEMQVKRGYDTVTLDFEHQSDPRHPNYKAGPIETAGHGTIAVVEGDGVFFESKKYTPTGVRYAASYPDVSGVFWVNGKREVILISSVALTLNGAVEGAEFAEATDRYLAACIAAAMTGPVLAEAEGTTDERILALGRELLGYGDDAMPEDVVVGLDELLKAKRANEAAEEEDDEVRNPKSEIRPSELARNPKLEIPTETIPDKDKPETELTPQMSKEITDKLDALTKVVESLVANQTSIAASVTQLKERDDTTAHNAQVEQVIAASIQAGKVVPASVKAQDDKGRYKMDATSAKEIMECIPASVSTTADKTAKAKSGDDSLTAAEEEARLACGISLEDWNKPGVLKLAFEPVKDVKVA